MAYSTAFDAFLNDTILVNTLASVSTDGYGTDVFSTSASTFKARVIRKQQLVRTFAGTEELAHTVAWIASTSTFAPSVQLTVNGSTLGPLMALESFPDEDGIHHLKAAWGN